MIGLRYVGSGVLASAVSMDKSYAKPIFAAAGHPHAVFPTTYEELMKSTNAKAMKVGD